MNCKRLESLPSTFPCTHANELETLIREKSRKQDSSSSALGCVMMFCAKHLLPSILAKCTYTVNLKLRKVDSLQKLMGQALPESQNEKTVSTQSQNFQYRALVSAFAELLDPPQVH